MAYNVLELKFKSLRLFALLLLPRAHIKNNWLLFLFACECCLCTIFHNERAPKECFLEMWAEMPQIISLSLFQHKMFNCVSYKFGVKRNQTKFNTIRHQQRVEKNLIERGLPLLEVLTRATEYLFFFSSNFINHIVLCVCVCNQPRTLQQFVHTHSIKKMMSF